MKEKSIRGKVPIYGVTLEVVVTDDMIKSQLNKMRNKRLGGQKPVPSAGLCIYAGWNFCVMFDKHYLDNNLIAHECFHLTHRIADYCGLKFKNSRHEEFAYLNGFVSNVVYKQLKQWKIRVK